MLQIKKLLDNSNIVKICIYLQSLPFVQYSVYSIMPPLLHVVVVQILQIQKGYQTPLQLFKHSEFMSYRLFDIPTQKQKCKFDKKQRMNNICTV